MSPTVLRSGKYSVMIFVDDHPPAHVHVFSAGKRAKINLDPVEIEEVRGGFNPRELRRVIELVETNRELLLRVWHEIQGVVMVGKVEEKDEAVALEFREGRIWITLRDSRIVSMPLSFFSWLDKATPEQREHYELYPEVILWPDLDEGIDMYAFVTGNWTKRSSLSQVG